MEVLKEYKTTGDERHFGFHCPGCACDHLVPTPRWTWNGDMTRPSFNPSLLIFKDDPTLRCHSFITDGRIMFLTDCHHKLAGQTVELPGWDDSDWWGNNR